MVLAAYTEVGTAQSTAMARIVNMVMKVRFFMWFTSVGYGPVLTIGTVSD